MPNTAEQQSKIPVEKGLGFKAKRALKTVGYFATSFVIATLALNCSTLPAIPTTVLNSGTTGNADKALTLDITNEGVVEGGGETDPITLETLNQLAEDSTLVNLAGVYVDSQELYNTVNPDALLYDPRILTSVLLLDNEGKFQQNLVLSGDNPWNLLILQNTGRLFVNNSLTDEKVEIGFDPLINDETADKLENWREMQGLDKDFVMEVIGAFKDGLATKDSIQPQFNGEFLDFLQRNGSERIIWETVILTDGRSRISFKDYSSLGSYEVELDPEGNIGYEKVTEAYRIIQEFISAEKDLQEQMKQEQEEFERKRQREFLEQNNLFSA